MILARAAAASVPVPPHLSFRSHTDAMAWPASFSQPAASRHSTASDTGTDRTSSCSSHRQNTLDEARKTVGTHQCAAAALVRARLAAHPRTPRPFTACQSHGSRCAGILNRYPSPCSTRHAVKLYERTNAQRLHLCVLAWQPSRTRCALVLRTKATAHGAQVSTICMLSVG